MFSVQQTQRLLLVTQERMASAGVFESVEKLLPLPDGFVWFGCEAKYFGIKDIRTDRKGITVGVCAPTINAATELQAELN